jgi:hypothetical protein
MLAMINTLTNTLWQTTKDIFRWMMEREGVNAMKTTEIITTTNMARAGMKGSANLPDENDVMTRFRSKIPSCCISKEAIQHKGLGLKRSKNGVYPYNLIAGMTSEAGHKRSERAITTLPFVPRYFTGEKGRVEDTWEKRVKMIVPNDEDRMKVRDVVHRIQQQLKRAQDNLLDTCSHDAEKFYEMYEMHVQEMEDGSWMHKEGKEYVQCFKMMDLLIGMNKGLGDAREELRMLLCGEGKVATLEPVSDPAAIAAAILVAPRMRKEGKTTKHCHEQVIGCSDLPRWKKLWGLLENPKKYIESKDMCIETLWYVVDGVDALYPFMAMVDVGDADPDDEMALQFLANMLVCLEHAAKGGDRIPKDLKERAIEVKDRVGDKSCYVLVTDNKSTMQEVVDKRLAKYKTFLSKTSDCHVEHLLANGIWKIGSVVYTANADDITSIYGEGVFEVRSIMGLARMEPAAGVYSDSRFVNGDGRDACFLIGQC